MCDEPTLINRCRNGDTRAFRVLVERYENRIYPLAFSILGHAELAREASQEAFLRAFKALDKFEGKSSFYTWLYRITANVSLNLAQRENRRPDTVPLETIHETLDLAPDLFFGAENPGNDLENQALRNQIQRVLNRLSPDHRAVVVLKDIEDLSQEEIAEALGISIGTVKSRLFRARKHLRDLLRPIYDEWMGKEPP